MREIGTFEAKTKLSELLDAVEAGEEILLTRRGHPVARLVPVAAPDHRERARAAAAAIRELRRGLTLGGIPIKDLINEGRRF